MLFKVLVIQAAYNLSDERAEFLINDRLCSSGSWAWGLNSTPYMQYCN